MPRIDLGDGYYVDAPEQKEAAPGPYEGSSKVVVKEDPQGSLGLQRSFFGAFNETLAALPDAAINMAMYGLEEAGMVAAPKNPGENRDVLRRVFNAANYEDKQKIMGFLSMGTPGTEVRPASFGEKLAAGGGQSTAMAVPMLGAQVAGTRGATYVGEAAKPIVEKLARDNMAKPSVLNAANAGAQQLAQKTVQGLAERPGAVLAGEVLASAASGAGGVAEQELVGTRTGLGDLAGGIVGSMAPAVASPILTTMRKFNLFDKAWQGVKDVKDYATTGQVAVTPEASNRASRRVQAELDDAMRSSYDKGNLQKTAEIQQDLVDMGMPSPKWSAAEASLDPTLAKEQAAIQLKARGIEARANQERVDRNTDIAFQYANKVLDTDPDGADTIVVREKARIENERKGISYEQADLDEENASLLSRFNPLKNRNDPVRRQRDKLVKAKEAKKSELDKYAEDLGINQLGGSADVTKLKAVANQIFTTGSSTTDALLPKAMQLVMDMPDDQLTFKGYKMILDKVQDDIGAAKANGRMKTVQQLSDFQEGLKEFADEAFPQQMETLKKFNDRYRDEYALPFTKGLVHKLTERESLGGGKYRYITDDENAAKLFLEKEDNMAEYVRVFQKDPAALQDMKNVIMDQLSEQARGSRGGPLAGSIDPEKLNTYINKNREVLDALGIRDELTDIQKVSDNVAIRRQALKAREDALNEDRLTKLINKYDNADLGADGVIKNIIAEGKRGDLHKIKNRITAMDDPEEAESTLRTLKSAVMTQVMRDVDITDPDKFQAAIKKHQSTLGALWSDAELERVKRVGDLMLRVRFAADNAAGRGVEHKSVLNAAEEFFGTSARSATAEVRAAQQGRTSPGNAGVFFLARFLNARSERAYEEMFKENMINRDFSKDMDTLLQDAASPNGPSISENAPLFKRVKDLLFDKGFDVRARTYLQNPVAQPSGEPYRETPEQVLDLDNPQLPAAPAPKLLGAGNAEFNAPRAPSPVPTPEQGSRNEITVNPLPRSSGGASSSPAASSSPSGGSSPSMKQLFPNDPLSQAIEERRTPQQMPAPR